MKYITKENIEDFLPNYIDINLAYEKGLATETSLKDEYFQLYSIYYNYLEKFLNEFLKLNEYENYLDNSNSNFKMVPESEQDIYQYLSNNKYFYIRNNLYVEKLSKDDIVYLLNNSNNYDEVVKEIISRTFHEVISVSLIDNPISNIFYGPTVATYAAPSNNLVLGIRFDEEDSDLYETEDKWFEDYNNRRKLINDLLITIPKQIKDTDINFIEYFEESVKKKSSNSDVIVK